MALKEGYLQESSTGKSGFERLLPFRENRRWPHFPRESLGIDLKQIYQKTKINREHLEWLEEENFANLPALVYIRGFIMEYAKALNLDPHRVSDSYLESYHQWRKERNG
jgi:hypothetical protein